MLWRSVAHDGNGGGGCSSNLVVVVPTDFAKMQAKILRKPLRFPSRLRLPASVESFIRGLCERNPQRRLGCAGRGVKEIKAHPLFAGLKWSAVLNRVIAPPYRPRFDRRIDDTRNFDREFTRVAPLDTSEYDGDDDDDDGSNSHFADFTFTAPECLKQESEEEEEVVWTTPVRI